VAAKTVVLTGRAPFSKSFHRSWSRGGRAAHALLIERIAASATPPWLPHVERGVAEPGGQRQRAAMRRRWRAAPKRRGSLRLKIFLKAQRLRA